jgi:hypothetical protein
MIPRRLPQAKHALGSRGLAQKYHKTQRKVPKSTPEVIGHEGLVTRATSRDNVLVTITYSNGTRVRAMLLTRTSDTLRVAVEGQSDATEFYCADSAWVSENFEAVTIEFEWEQQRPKPVPSVDDCICSPDLAEQLMAQLLNPAGDQLEDMLYVLSADNLRAGLPRTATLVN